MIARTMLVSAIVEGLVARPLFNLDDLTDAQADQIVAAADRVLQACQRRPLPEISDEQRAITEMSNVRLVVPYDPYNPILVPEPDEEAQDQAEAQAEAQEQAEGQEAPAE